MIRIQQTKQNILRDKTVEYKVKHNTLISTYTPELVTLVVALCHRYEASTISLTQFELILLN